MRAYEESAWRKTMSARRHTHGHTQPHNGPEQSRSSASRLPGRGRYSAGGRRQAAVGGRERGRARPRSRELVGLELACLRRSANRAGLHFSRLPRCCLFSLLACLPISRPSRLPLLSASQPANPLVLLGYRFLATTTNTTRQAQSDRYPARADCFLSLEMERAR